MIKIIKKGNINQPKYTNVYQFICIKCFCEFEASGEDIINGGTAYMKRYAKCPTCGKHLSIEYKLPIRQEPVVDTEKK